MTYTYSDIDAYLNGELNAEEQQAFEQELRSNQQLREQVNAYRLLNSTVGKHQQAEQTLPELKQILDPLTHQYFKKEKAKVITMRRTMYMLAAAASVVLILMLTLPGTSPDNYSFDDMPGAIVRGAEDEKAKAAQLFNNKQYAEAATAFTNLRTTAPADATVDFYLGISLLKTGKYVEALPLFETLANGTSVYAEDANFFAALSAYHLQQNEKAKQYAEKVKEGSRNWKNAKAIIKKVE
jgi:tetratricopeptide (TPR) repeat protein